jgi:YfiH family protein
VKADAPAAGATEVIRPDWPAPARVTALVTTRQFGDMASEESKLKVKQLVGGEPLWLRQVHGTTVADADSKPGTQRPQADAAVARKAGSVCVVMAADCMPVLLADEAGSVVAAAHAGWRGLCAGVIEATVGEMRAAMRAAMGAAMRVPEAGIIAWLGPAIGPRVYEVGEEVRAAFLERDAAAATAFVATRPGHWLLDLYAVARQRLAKLGVERIYGGGLCTYSDAERFYSYRRDRASSRMAALIWLS